MTHYLFDVFIEDVKDVPLFFFLPVTFDVIVPGAPRPCGDNVQEVTDLQESSRCLLLTLSAHELVDETLPGPRLGTGRMHLMEVVGAHRGVLSVTGNVDGL